MGRELTDGMSHTVSRECLNSVPTGDPLELDPAVAAAFMAVFRVWNTEAEALGVLLEVVQAFMLGAVTTSHSVTSSHALFSMLLAASPPPSPAAASAVAAARHSLETNSSACASACAAVAAVRAWSANERCAGYGGLRHKTAPMGKNAAAPPPPVMLFGVMLHEALPSGSISQQVQEAVLAWWPEQLRKAQGWAPPPLSSLCLDCATHSCGL